MMLETGFVTHSEYQKHIRGEWRTVHDLWRHIRNYMTSYAQPGGFTQGSIAFADATGFLAEDNANLFWDNTNKRLGLGTPTPDTALHIKFPAVEVVESRLSAKVRPWRQWECIDGNWGLAIGIHANDGRIHLNYDVPIGTLDTSMIVFDGPNARVGIQEAIPAFPLDIGVGTRIQSSLLVTGAVTFDVTLGVTGAVTFGDILDVTGAVTFADILDVTGAVTFADVLGVTGDTTLSKVIVTGDGADAINLTGATAQIQFLGAAGEKGIGYKDTGGDHRYAMMFPNASDVVHVLNRAANGTVEIHANTAVAGAPGDVLVAEFQDDIINLSVDLAIRSQKELRFYDNDNYVGFEAPDLVGNTIWILPDADGDAGDVIITSGAGVLSFSPAGTGDVSAAAVMTDHAIVRGDGGAKGVQDTGILVDDSDNMTLPDGASLTLQESIVFAGATTENIISFPDNIAVALSFMEGANPYLTFVTTNGSEAVSLAKTLILSTVINAGVDTDKFLVLDAGDRIDFRTGAELLADIGGVAAATFVGLTDTPANYVGDAGKVCRVNVGEDGLEFAAGAAAAIDYLDLFEDASIHWSWRTDNLDGDRTIVEAANKLTIAIVPGTNYNWWDTMNDAPKIFTGIGRPPCEIITKLITITTNNETRAGIFVASNPIGVGADYAMMLSRRTVAGVESLQVQRLGTGYTAYGGAPFTTLPIWLKIRITADIRYGNHLRFYFSVNGIDWTELADPAGGYSDLLTSDGFVVGLFAQNWNELAVSAEFDFFRVVPSLGADG